MDTRRGLILLTCLALSSCAFQARERRPSRFLIPEGYAGWVRINFRVEGAPALPLEDGRYLFKVPPSGAMETSTDIETGAATDEYYYYCGEARRRLELSAFGGRGMIWAGAAGSARNSFGETASVFEEFFVGTEEELEKYGAARRENSGPTFGPAKATALPCTE